MANDIGTPFNFLPSLAAVLLLAVGSPPLQAQNSTPRDQIYYFPHLAVGAGWQTTITYINYSPEEVTCQTDFISDHESPLMVSFAGLGTVDSRTDVLPPGGSVHQETDVDLSAPLAPGWARATCSGPVKASLLYRLRNSEGAPTAEVGVNAAAVPATRFVTFAEQGEGQFGTGVAYANPSATSAHVTFTARDTAGEVLASVDRTLLPGGHDAHGMAELFDLTSFTGSIEVTSTEPIVSLSINLEAAPVFSSLPPGDIPGEMLAPTDEAAFNDLFVGKRAATNYPTVYVDFVSPGRFRETEGSDIWTGSYTYRNTGPNTGTVTFNYDDGDRCVASFTFVSTTAGTATYTCNDGSSGGSNWLLVVAIPDANLRAAIEAALGKASGAPITEAEMKALTVLEAPNAGISDLTGLGFATNLTELELDYNRRISDLSPIAGLTNVTKLYLRFNRITDVSSLEGLTKLTSLALAANAITDVSSLGRVTSLSWLELAANRITDVSVLGGLPNLTSLDLEQNAITDASGVGDLANLVNLRLAFNAITDVSSLERLTNLQYLDLQGNPLSLTSINDRLPALERNGVTVRFDRFPKGDFDIELVFVGDFIEGQKSVLEYAARRWMSVITEDLPDYEFTQGWSGKCAGLSIEIPAGERIDGLRIYVGSFEDAEGPSGYGGTSLLRENHLPIVGCMTFNSDPGYWQVTGSHEVGHALGFGQIWGHLSFRQDHSRDDPNADTHFNGPLAIAAFDDAGGRDYTGAKVPVQKMDGSHWRIPVLQGELMGPRGGSALSAITVQSLADLGYGVDVRQADPYTLPDAAAAILEDDRLSGSLASPTHAEPKLWCGLDGEQEQIYVIDQQGRIIRTIGN